jgi:hypothetical protein
MVRGMKIRANAGIWSAFLGASQVHQNLEFGRHAAEKLLDLEPHKTSNYVLLLHMHAKVGSWEEVERVRVSMKKSRVEKQPGCSWIELINQIHAFLSDNQLQPRTTEVCKTLKALTAHLRNPGDLSEFKSLLDVFLLTMIVPSPNIYIRAILTSCTLGICHFSCTNSFAIVHMYMSYWVLFNTTIF